VFLAIGNDVNTAAYRVEAAGGDVFYLKLRAGETNLASVLVPRFLTDSGVRTVLAPLLCSDGRLQVSIGRFTASLYPFVEGRNAFESALSPAQWTVFGLALRQLHDSNPPQEVARFIPREIYAGSLRDSARHFLTRVGKERFVDPIAARLATLFDSHRDVLKHVVDRAETLAGQLAQQPPDRVLCHGDIHAANLLIDAAGQLYLVDWDTLVFAPRERDLMFIGGGVGGAWNRPEEERWFYHGYGPVEVSRPALQYYRYERIVEDVVAYCELLLQSERGGRDRERSLGKIAAQFDPGNVVDMALRGE
jgi:spectinomycin phosphotransferase